MDIKLLTIQRELSLLSVFRGLKNTPLIAALEELLSAIEEGSKSGQGNDSGMTDCKKRILESYGAFCSFIYQMGGNLSCALKDLVLKDENPYLDAVIQNKQISASLSSAAKKELSLFTRIAQLTQTDFREMREMTGYFDDLPLWETSEIDIEQSFFSMIESVSTNGYGIFASATVFKTGDDGSLKPIHNTDILPLSSLYGYERERGLVLDNTYALAAGMHAANVLLYGDAGTGKSSTIKACAAEYFHLGVRLIEFKKNQLKFIPALTEQLAGSPLKFIFYIDDLSFRADDDDFCFLKGILEGDVAGDAANIRIYASSNRRHLIRESFDARIGNDIHLSDTLQETMSLSDRFGLTVTFSKPEKDLYLSIVEKLAEEYGILMNQDELFLQAEAFAIRTNGRSPRTAKQFVQSLSVYRIE